MTKLLEKKLWLVAEIKGMSPKVSHAGGGIWMNKLYVFGGWNGKSEQQALFTLDLGCKSITI